MYGYVKGKRVSFDPSRSIGKGGEADIFDLGSGLAGKIFKQPDHPDFNGLDHERAAAVARISEHQQKLLAFPKNLPATVIAPQDLVTNQTGDKILGYTMQLLKGADLLLSYAQRDFRKAVPNSEVLEVFRSLHQTVDLIHGAQVVIGDFNDLNIMVHNRTAFVIDSDSFDFNQFRCRVFTQKFVDPTRCDPNARSLSLMQPYTANSDWYAFAVMLMQCLLFVDPYGGVYRPAKAADRLPHDMRPLKRITVFDPEVRYPKPAIPYGVLPDELLHLFVQIFSKDQRGIFPKAILENLRWTTCTQCGTEHARSQCPQCKFAAPAAVQAVTKIFGTVMVTRVFSTTGTILHSSLQQGQLKWLYNESSTFFREGKKFVMQGDVDRQFRYRISGSKTIVGKGSQLVILQPGVTPHLQETETSGGVPMFDTTSNYLLWIENGRLLRSDEFAPTFIGNVLSGQTLFWSGDDMGFGYYRAGNLSVAFVFNPTSPGINDRVKLPPLGGQIIDAYCLFGKTRAWFFVSTRTAGKTVNHCMVILQDGTVEASTEVVEGSGGWLSTLRGKSCTGQVLFSATDDGIVRVQSENGQLTVKQEFVETERFVNANSQLHVSPEGIYVVNSKEILLLKITR